MQTLSAIFGHPGGHFGFKGYHRMSTQNKTPIKPKMSRASKIHGFWFILFSSSAEKEKKTGKN